jgi:hypothetical protein
MSLPIETIVGCYLALSSRHSSLSPIARRRSRHMEIVSYGTHFSAPSDSELGNTGLDLRFRNNRCLLITSFLPANIISWCSLLQLVVSTNQSLRIPCEYPLQGLLGGGTVARSSCHTRQDENGLVTGTVQVLVHSFQSSWQQ